MLNNLTLHPPSTTVNVGPTNKESTSTCPISTGDCIKPLHAEQPGTFPQYFYKVYLKMLIVFNGY